MCFPHIRPDGGISEKNTALLALVRRTCFLGNLWVYQRQLPAEEGVMWTWTPTTYPTLGTHFLEFPNTHRWDPLLASNRMLSLLHLSKKWGKGRFLEERVWGTFWRSSWEDTGPEERDGQEKGYLHMGTLLSWVLWCLFTLVRYKEIRKLKSPILRCS